MKNWAIEESLAFLWIIPTNMLEIASRYLIQKQIESAKLEMYNGWTKCISDTTTSALNFPKFTSIEIKKSSPKNEFDLTKDDVETSDNDAIEGVKLNDNTESEAREGAE